MFSFSSASWRLRPQLSLRFSIISSWSTRQNVLNWLNDCFWNVLSLNSWRNGFDQPGQPSTRDGHRIEIVSMDLAREKEAHCNVITVCLSATEKDRERILGPSFFPLKRWWSYCSERKAANNWRRLYRNGIGEEKLRRHIFCHYTCSMMCPTLQQFFYCFCLHLNFW